MESLILNAGAREGVRKGSPVVTGDGLVGRIAGVGYRSARVLLITDLNSRIPVLVEPTGMRAILAGDNSDRPRLIRLPPGATVSPGERVSTSGRAGAFPAGCRWASWPRSATAASACSPSSSETVSSTFG